jgi:hypothetical protein
MRFKLFTIPFTTMLLAAAGCGPSEGTVTGRLALSSLRGVRTDVVATLADGTARRATVGDDGRFTIEVPRGAALAIAFARRSDGGAAHVAQLVRRDRQAVVRVDDDADLGELVELGDDRDEAGDDRGDDGAEPGDDHGGRGCHTMTPGDAAITTTPSFLVVGSTELPAEAPPSTGPLADDDGDGWPTSHDDDRDDDGLCDDHDDDVPDAGDHDDDVPDGGIDDDDDDGRADLPYHVDPALGSSFALVDAFLEKGAAPARISSVEVAGGWRAAELAAGTRFAITEADCSHAGNKGTGRDRIFVAWENADGSRELDHFELRYCDDDR